MPEMERMTQMATGQFNRVIEHLRNITIREDGAGLTDGQLLGRFVDFRDEAAVAALVRRHGAMVWGACLRILRNQHDAEDAFQATFLVLMRKAASVAPREMLANWLYGVANQTSLKARATRAKRRSREKQLMEMSEPSVQHDFRDDLQPVLDEELSRLPDLYRSVVVLCDLEGKTRKQAARQLSCPEGTVASRLAIARRMLAKRLVQRGLATSGGMLAAIVPKASSAVVPSSLMVSTIRVVTEIATGQAATAAVSAAVVDLTQGVVKAMLMGKLKTASAVIVVVLGLVACGGGLLEHQRASGQQVEAKANQERSECMAKAPEPASPQSAPPKRVKDYKTVFNKTLEVLNDYFAQVANANQYDGRILSYSALGKAAIEQERSDPSIRRRADTQITARDETGTFEVQVHVFKEVEIKDSPKSGETDWVRIGRDRALEEIILKRLAAQQINVVQNGVPADVAGAPIPPAPPPPATYSEATPPKKEADKSLDAEARGKEKPLSERAKPSIWGEVLKIEVADLLVHIVVETDKQIVYLTSDEVKKGDETYRITNKTIVLRGDSMKRIRLAEIRPGDRVSIELAATESRVSQIVVGKNTQ